MDFFISDAVAATGTTAGGNSLASFIPLVLIFVVFYFLLIRPQNKRAKEHREMVSALGVGDEVVTNGGIAGKVTKVGEQYLSLELADGLVIKLQKHAVAAVLPKGTLKTL